MTGESLQLRPIGTVESSLRDREAAPKQGDEGAPPARLVLDESVRKAAQDLVVGEQLLVLTWLDRGSRDVQQVHPRGDPDRPMLGVFSTRSPDRPNPIGLHRVTIASIADLRIEVRDLEALDGTPILDIKPILSDKLDR